MTTPAMMVTDGMPSKRRRYEMLRVQLENERQSFLAHWKELARYILPRRIRVTAEDTNRGDRRNQDIIDATATLASRVLASGMMSGVTSPARPWFHLTTPDPDLAEQAEVKEWLHALEGTMNAVLSKSNIYDALPICYADLGVFGTHAMGMLEDEEHVVRFEPYPIGSYALANDDKMRVTAFVRSFKLTVRQLVEMFGRPNGERQVQWDVFSLTVRQAWERGNYEQWIDVVHVICPNDAHDPAKLDSRHKAFTSCYYEAGSREEVYLEEKGFDEFPVLAPRWEVTAGDVYGTNCPGMTALGDIKQLQLGERRKLQAIEKQINPPMQAPVSLMSRKVSIIPGDITYNPDANADALRPIYQITFDLAPLENTQAMVRERIENAFFVRLFLLTAESDRRDVTAREIDERHEEKLLQLGPVLSRLDTDLLDRIIDRLFAILLRRGMVPDAPEALQGVPLRIEYISIMAQAQKMVGLAGIDRFAQGVVALAEQAQRPDILDKVNFDELVDVLGEMTGVPPKLIVSTEDAAQARQARAQAVQAQQQAEQAATAAKTAQTLSQTDTEGDNGLTRLINMTRGGQPGVAA